MYVGVCGCVWVCVGVCGWVGVSVDLEGVGPSLWVLVKQVKQVSSTLLGGSHSITVHTLPLGDWFRDDVVG